MKRKELTKTFMMISNCKLPFGPLVYIVGGTLIRIAKLRCDVVNENLFYSRPRQLFVQIPYQYFTFILGVRDVW